MSSKKSSILETTGLGATTELKILGGAAGKLNSTTEASTASTDVVPMSGHSRVASSTAALSFGSQLTQNLNATFSSDSSGFGTKTTSAIETHRSSAASFSFGETVSTLPSQTTASESAVSITSPSCSDLPSVTRNPPTSILCPPAKTTASLEAPTTLPTFKFGSSVEMASSSNTSNTAVSATSPFAFSFTIPAPTSLCSSGARGNVPTSHSDCIKVNNVHTDTFGTSSSAGMSVSGTTGQAYDFSLFNAGLPTITSTNECSVPGGRRRRNRYYLQAEELPSPFQPFTFGDTLSSAQFPTSRECTSTTVSFEAAPRTCMGRTENILVPQDQNLSTAVLPDIGNLLQSHRKALVQESSTPQGEGEPVSMPVATEKVSRLESTIKQGFADVNTAIQRLTDTFERSLCPREQASTDAGKSSFGSRKEEDTKTPETLGQTTKLSSPDNVSYSSSATAYTFDHPTESGDKEVHLEEASGTKKAEKIALSESHSSQDQSEIPSVSLGDVFELVRALKAANCSADDMVSLISLAREMKQADVTAQDLADMKDYFQKPF